MRQQGDAAGELCEDHVQQQAIFPPGHLDQNVTEHVVQCIACPSFIDDDSDAESCTTETYPRSLASRRPSLVGNVISFVLPSAAPSEPGKYSFSPKSAVKSDSLELSRFSAGIQEVLTSLSQDVTKLREQVNTLEGALDLERQHRLEASQRSHKTIDHLSKDFVQFGRECSKRLSDVEHMSRDSRHSSVASLGLAQSCISSVNEVWSMLSKKTEESVAFQAGVQDAVEMLRVDLVDVGQEVAQQTELVEGLRQSLDQNTISFKELCAKQEDIVVDVKKMKEAVADLEQSLDKEAVLIRETCSEQLLVNVKEIQEAVERECQEREQEHSDLGSGIAELRVGLDRAFHHLATVMISQEIAVESKQVAADETDVRHSFPPYHTFDLSSAALSSLDSVTHSAPLSAMSKAA